MTAKQANYSTKSSGYQLTTATQRQPLSIELSKSKTKTDGVQIDALMLQVGPILQQILERGEVNHQQWDPESLAKALAAHMVINNHNCRPPDSPQPYQGGLPPFQLNRVTAYIEANLDRELSLAEIAEKLGMSPYYFCRQFKQAIDITPHAYIIQRRVEKAKSLLSDKEMSILTIALACGFANPSHFAKCFRKETGISPKEFRMSTLSNLRV
jgi:AraC family transcriptional regulator